MAEKKNKSKTLNDWKILKEASQEVESWPKWMQQNADLLFEEEQEKQRKAKDKPASPNRNREASL